MKQTLRSVTEIPNFPFSSYEEFVSANQARTALVWVRFDFRIAWQLGTLSEKCGYLIFLGAAWIAAVGFGILAWLTHQNGFLFGIPVCLLCWMYRSGLVSVFGNGCLPHLSLILGLVLTPFLRFPVALIGFASYSTWFLASAAIGVFDGTVRAKMVSSEAEFLWFYEHHVITDVGRSSTPQT